MVSGGGGDNSWPMALRSAAHPQHDLAYQLLRGNRCDICGGTIAAEFRYRCDTCDFDAHGGCLRPDPRTQARTTLPVLPTANAPHHPPPPLPPVVQPARPRPSSSSYAAPAPPPQYHQCGHASALPAPAPPQAAGQCVPVRPLELAPAPPPARRADLGCQSCVHAPSLSSGAAQPWLRERSRSRCTGELQPSSSATIPGHQQPWRLHG
ncbi:hypothetical protein GQ55_3G400100 [Panicum hallii var. hallii]|uniref:DC1 domain-containing protein n=1 Tax=Panicum hallii var. hallii TaxID=1504633 RepID=A0A2T7EGU7_9POAL|nr:hypothetical protein GQ55_3G400100 [Panicum hallii var. hallii]